MNFNKHSNLEGQHAFLGASKYHWIFYDEGKLQKLTRERLRHRKEQSFMRLLAQCIKLRQKLPKSRKTLNMYVNDAIGYRMTPEQILYYSPNCFGTADAISFQKGFLRIHDLKTGATPAHMEQLVVYASLFCLEYGVKPGSIDFELRIYQSDDILISNPTVEDIAPVMDKIITFDRIINGYFEGGRMMGWNDDFLMHYGVGKLDGSPGRGSGRYPLGSGKKPHQHSGDFISRVEELRRKG